MEDHEPPPPEKSKTFRQGLDPYAAVPAKSKSAPECFKAEGVNPFKRHGVDPKDYTLIDGYYYRKGTVLYVEAMRGAVMEARARHFESKAPKTQGKLSVHGDSWSLFSTTDGESFRFPSRRQASAAIEYLWKRGAFSKGTAVPEVEICQHVWEKTDVIKNRGAKPQMAKLISCFNGHADAKRFYKEFISPDGHRRYFLKV